MQKANVFRLTNQEIPLTEILPPDTLICLAPAPVKDFIYLSLIHLLEETKWLLYGLTKQPEFNILNPVYIILENTKNAWIASRMIEAAFARFNNDPKIWIIQGNFREFIDLQRFVVEGIDFAQTHEHKRCNQFTEYPTSIGERTMSNNSDNEPMQQYHYFLTVDWCRQGKRGIFSSRGGIGYFKEGAPHTEDEIWKILGAFDLILDPKSLPFTEEELAKYTRWFPLAEYNNEYGYALRKEQLENSPTFADCP